MHKTYPDAKAALAGLLHDGMTIMAGGFGLSGIPEKLIAEIKASGVHDREKLQNIHAELAALQAAYARSIEPSAELDALADELRGVNAGLWVVENEMRACERSGDFGPRFVELARQVYGQNDRRAVVTRRINELLRSRYLEEKSYVD